jgi:CheY-like chemotaxis protein
VPARILIVEDNAPNLQLVEYLLQASGHHTLAAADGVEGLSMVRAGRPHLILCDLQMPRMNGYELLRLLKEDAVLRGIPVVAVTAQSMVGDRDAALAAGFDGYMAKPIEPQTFVASVEQYLPAGLRSNRSAG